MYAHRSKFISPRKCVYIRDNIYIYSIHNIVLYPWALYIYIYTKNNFDSDVDLIDNNNTTTAREATTLKCPPGYSRGGKDKLSTEKLCTKLYYIFTVPPL